MIAEIKQMKGFNFLWLDNYLWMWDTVPELKAQKRISDQAYGDVIVAGYGLGVIQKQLKGNPRVISVTSVEKYMEVIKANVETFGVMHGAVTRRDFFDFEENRKYDCVIGDVWQDILPEGLSAYKLFKEKALKLVAPGGKILAWGQDYFEYLISKEGGKSK